MAKYSSKHRCMGNVRNLSSKETAKTADNLFYEYTADHEYKLYKVLEVMDKELIYVLELKVIGKMFARQPELHFENVGIFEDHGLLPTKRVVKVSDIHGKLVKVNTLYMTASRNVLIAK